DRLVMAIAAIVGRAASAAALDEEQLGFVAVARGAVHQLAGEAAGVEDALAILEGLLRLGRRLARLRREDDLLHDLLRVLRVLFEELRQELVEDARDDAFDLRIVEANLRLRLELRLGNLDADNGRDALAVVLATGRDVFEVVLLRILAIRRQGA